MTRLNSSLIASPLFLNFTSAILTLREKKRKERRRAMLGELAYSVCPCQKSFLAAAAAAATDRLSRVWCISRQWHGTLHASVRGASAAA